MILLLNYTVTYNRG